MIIKVCGMRDPENIRAINRLGIDMMGFIFYSQSSRYVSDIAVTECVSAGTAKVGVFVDASCEDMMETARRCALDYLQLHGDESPDMCHTLQKRGMKIIKAFGISNADDVVKAEEYEGRVDYFLFDTRCNGYGGSGKRFDWTALKSYTGKTPFLLSGGITPAAVEDVIAFSHPQFAGIDLNSGFETSPGLKDPDMLDAFLKRMLPLFRI
jgi:phosphoribosylanthranilate isomerase